MKALSLSIERQCRRLAPALARVSGAAFLLAAGILCFCAPGRKGELSEPAAGPGPTELTADVADGGARLRWRTNRDGSIPISGYNIYVSAQPILDLSIDAKLPSDVSPINDSPYPGDTDPAYDVETYPLTGLENGETYYVVVTTIYTGGAESTPSNQIELIPRPEGDFILKRSFSGDHDGFSFAQQAPVATDDLANDIYLTTIEGRLYVASPSRIDDVLRETRFFPLGRRGELGEIRVGELKVRGRNKLELQVGEVFILLNADGCFALIKPNAVDERAGEVSFSFIYQPKPNTMRF